VELLGKRRRIGRTERGTVYEQAARVHGGGAFRDMRRVDIELDQPTEDGERMVVLFTNAPSTMLAAVPAAELYLARWSIENMFQRLESALNSEIKTLAHPRAALFAFGTA